MGLNEEYARRTFGVPTSPQQGPNFKVSAQIHTLVRERRV